MMLRKRQEVFVERSLAALAEHKNTLGVAPTGCHVAGTLILMFDGTLKRVEDICVGDVIMGPDSGPRTVSELHQGEDTLYQIRPLKGEPFVVNAGHILSLVKTNQYNDHRQHWGTPAGTVVDISVEEYLRTSANFKHLHKLFRARVDFADEANEETLAIDPYFLGLLLGDGSLKYGTPSITTADFEVVDYCLQMAKHLGVSVREEQLAGSEANDYHFHVRGSRRNVNPLTAALRDLGVYGKGADEKCIPQACKTGSRKTRAAVLAGLLDTDGYCKNNCIEFTSASRMLSDDVAFVARSLGFFALPKEKIVKGKTYYRFLISGDFSDIPLRVARRIPGPRRQKKNPLRTGFTVHQCGYGQYYGFTVDGDHRYVMGDFTVTHNSGKSVIMSAVIDHSLKHACRRVLSLAHREELIAQNRKRLEKFSPEISTSVFSASEKSWSGQAVFAMVQTLSQQRHLRAMPRIDLLVVDEAHHVAAPTYRRIIDHAQKHNPDLQIYGVTASPTRSDKRSLRQVFNNVADHVRIGEVIDAGHLVPPKTYVIDLGVKEALNQVRERQNEFDMQQVEKIMDTSIINDAVVKHWQEKAGDRKTVVFCSTVAHAMHTCKAFEAAGVKAAVIAGHLSHAERQQLLAQFDRGDLQVLLNCFVLTEGYDSPPISCVVLLRPNSQKSTFIQCVGRGLRTVDPEEYPGVVKNDCIVLDFGTSALRHGTLEQDIALCEKDAGENRNTHAYSKTCPACEAIVPARSRTCGLCGANLTDLTSKTSETQETAPLNDFVMSEIDLLKRSSFRWCDLFQDETSFLATGFDAWAGLFFLAGQWFAIGGGKNQRGRLLAKGDRTLCLGSADDWMTAHESEEAARKSHRWYHEAVTPQQLKFLPARFRHDYGLTRYHASCLLAFYFNKRDIQKTIFQQQNVA